MGLAVLAGELGIGRICHPEPFGHSERSEESQGKLREESDAQFLYGKVFPLRIICGY